MKFAIHIGLLGAMPQEIVATINQLENIKTATFGDLELHSGQLKTNDSNSPLIYLTLAWSGWGKVSAARAATRIIDTSLQEIPVSLLLFTGVAGAAKPLLEQWDVIIPDLVVQHDMDSSPIFPKYVIPAINKSHLKADPKLIEWATFSIRDSINKGLLQGFQNVSNGLIATGDSFISNKSRLSDLCDNLPGLMAVEMEGAAVAQVAIQENIPWLILRVISDKADHDAELNFNDFLEKYQERSYLLIESLCKNIKVLYNLLNKN